MHLSCIINALLSFVISTGNNELSVAGCSSSPLFYLFANSL
nr:MAG TPA: hypothetical protein [Caudoviricetes sp.]